MRFLSNDSIVLTFKYAERAQPFQYTDTTSGALWSGPPSTYWNVVTVYLILAYINHIWLVVYLPLWKIWLRHLGWWFFPIYGKSEKPCSKPPTSESFHVTWGQMKLSRLRILTWTKPPVSQTLPGTSWVGRFETADRAINFGLKAQLENDVTRMTYDFVKHCKTI